METSIIPSGETDQAWEGKLGRRTAARGIARFMSGKTIVIVDDEEDLRDNLLDLLEFMGYSVATCETAEEMLEMMPTLPAGLVLLDYQLPGMDGIEALTILKRDWPDLPVALVTASSQPAIIQRARDRGVDGIVFKPYDQAEILATVDKLFSGK